MDKYWLFSTCANFRVGANSGDSIFEYADEKLTFNAAEQQLVRWMVKHVSRINMKHIWHQ